MVKKSIRIAPRRLLECECYGVPRDTPPPAAPHRDPSLDGARNSPDPRKLRLPDVRMSGPRCAQGHTLDARSI